MTILYLTRAKAKKRAEQGHLGHFFPSILAGIDSRESLGLSALSAPDQQDPLENLSTDCLVCGGYLPRRKRIGGLHQLCQHYYDEQGA